MFSTFITNIEWIKIADYPGLIARCNFSVANYSNDFFSIANIHFPSHLTNAVTKRRAEYLAGRYLAHQVLKKLGYSNFTLLRGKDRAPLWPLGVSGSISHSKDTALCTANHTSAMSGIGIDIEAQMPAKHAFELQDNIISEMEYVLLHQQQQQQQTFEQLLTLVFSAKESLFKALYPQVRRYFDFLDARIIEFDTHKQVFKLELLKTLTPNFHVGRRFNGHYLINDKDITTLIHFEDNW